MMTLAEILRLISYCCFALALAFAVVAVIVYFKRNIRETIDELRGTTAKREIAQLSKSGATERRTKERKVRSASSGTAQAIDTGELSAQQDFEIRSVAGATGQTGSTGETGRSGRIGKTARTAKTARTISERFSGRSEKIAAAGGDEKPDSMSVSGSLAKTLAAVTQTAAPAEAPADIPAAEQDIQATEPRTPPVQPDEEGTALLDESGSTSAQPDDEGTALLGEEANDEGTALLGDEGQPDDEGTALLGEDNADAGEAEEREQPKTLLYADGVSFIPVDMKAEQETVGFKVTGSNMLTGVGSGRNE